MRYLILSGVVIAVLFGCGQHGASDAGQKTNKKSGQKKDPEIAIIYSGPNTYQDFVASNSGECVRGPEIVCRIEAKNDVDAPIKTTNGDVVCVYAALESIAPVTIEYSKSTKELLGAGCLISQEKYDLIRLQYRDFVTRSLPHGIKSVRRKEEVEAFYFNNQSIAVFKTFAGEFIDGLKFNYHIWVGNVDGLFE